MALFAASALEYVMIRWAVLCSGDLLFMGLAPLAAVIVSWSILFTLQISCQCLGSSGVSAKGTLKAIRLCTLEQKFTFGPIFSQNFVRFSLSIIHVVASSDSISTSAPPFRSLFIDRILILSAPKLPKILFSSAFTVFFTSLCNGHGHNMFRSLFLKCHCLLKTS